MSVRKLSIIKYKEGAWERVDDDVAVEEPLDVFVEGKRLATIMRLPPSSPEEAEVDRRLAAGFLFSEGVIDSADDLTSLSLSPHGSRADAWLTPERAERFLAAPPRQSVWTGEEEFIDPKPRLRKNSLSAAELMRVKSVFESRKDLHPLTGATHSALLFDKSLEMIAYAEDVGRHNALDKAIGELLLAGRRDEAFLAVMSSRQSYEIASKAARLGVEILIGVSTVTTLAASLADKAGITLIGFFRTGRMNVYTHPERIRFEPAGRASPRESGRESGKATGE